MFSYYRMCSLTVECVLLPQLQFAEMYNPLGVPHEELNGGSGGGDGEVPPLEELVYQDGVGYALRLY